MEGLYNGSTGQGLVAFGIINPSKERTDDQPAILGEITIPKGLSVLANHDAGSFVPGINDLIDGVSVNSEGDTVNTVGYAERIARGRQAQQALRDYDTAMKAGDKTAMAAAAEAVKADFNISATVISTALTRPCRRLPLPSMPSVSWLWVVATCCFSLLRCCSWAIASPW